MPTESIQFAPANRPAVQAGAQEAAAPQQQGSAAVLGGPGVRVSVTGSQLDKLVAKVKGETADARLDTAKRRIAIVLTTLAALNLQMTENQRNNLAKIEVLQGELDELKEQLEGAGKEKTASDAKAAALEAQIAILEKAVENAIKEGAEHRKQVDELKKTRAADDAELKAAETALAKSAAALAAAQANLTKARAELDDAKGKSESLKKDIADLKSRIAGVESQIDECAAAVGDKALAQVAASLRTTATDATAADARETEADRKKAEAKEIANDPLRVIREALDRMDEDIRRTVEGSRTLLV